MNTKLYSTSFSVPRLSQHQSNGNIAMSASTYSVAEYLIYCPACQQEYHSSQSQQHLGKHYMVQSYDFRMSKLDDHEKSLDKTRGSIQQKLEETEYPMVEPLQFNTKELSEVQTKNIYKIEIKETNKQAAEVINVKSEEVQTLGRPPLQGAQKESDFYNCLDNVFSSKAKFSIDDLIKNNAGLASKRKFTEWEEWKLKK